MGPKIRLYLVLILLFAGCTPKGPASLSMSILYTDMDGTLLDEEGQIADGNLKAIERFRKAGGRVGVATGRLPDIGKPVADLVGGTLPRVFANGAIVLDPSGKLLRLTMITDKNDVRTICERILSAGCGDIYTAWAHPESGEVRRINNACRPPDEEPWGVLKLRAKNCKEHETLLAELPGLVKGEYEIIEAGSGDYIGISISAGGATKGLALEYISNRLGVKLAKMAYVGDSGNDVSATSMLLAKGGKCFAVRNSAEVLKKACPRHTERNNVEGAVREAIYDLLGIQVPAENPREE